MHQRCPFFFLGVKSVLQSLCPWLWNSLLNKISSTNWPATVRLYSIPQSCHRIGSVLIKKNILLETEKTRHYLFTFLLVSSIAPSQPLFAVCACIMMPICKDHTVHLVLQLGIDPRQEERELVAVINQEWDKEKSTLMLFTLNLHLIHLVNPRHTVHRKH